jgi:RNA polymerase primary sigma factor
MHQLTISQSITKRDSRSVERYLLEIGKIELLTMEQEVQLAQAIRNGDSKALDTLTKANLRFVVSVAKQYQFRGIPLPDLINEGNVGLIKAALRFDETKGFKFISYAVWWVRQSIIQALGEQGRMVRLPSNKFMLANKLQKLASQLEQFHERTPSLAELASELQMQEAELSLMGDYNMSYVSLDAPSLFEGDETMANNLKDEKGRETDTIVQYTESLGVEIRRCLASLGEREKTIVCYFYGIGVPEALSVHQIAAMYNMSSERVRQIKDKAIKHLRVPTKLSVLREYLG